MQSFDIKVLVIRQSSMCSTVQFTIKSDDRKPAPPANNFSVASTLAGASRLRNTQIQPSSVRFAETQQNIIRGLTQPMATPDTALLITFHVH